MPKKKPRKITLDEYLSWLLAETVSFRGRWRRGQDKYGKKQWPNEMAPGDWDEQFQAHLSTVRQGDKAYEEG